MALRNIVFEGEEILTKRSREITEVTDRIKTTMEDMLETMRACQGVGLAAPQIGVLRRMFVAEPEPGRVYFMINPVILEERGCLEGEEACLSVPEVTGMVERPEYIKIEATDLDGERRTYEFSDFDARVMCHEYDHLDGVLFVNKALYTVPDRKYDEDYDD